MANIIRGKIKKPFRVLVYGPPGVGKSTQASKAPRPLFLDCEDGLANIDCERTSVIKSYDRPPKETAANSDEPETFMEWLRFAAKSEYQTIVIDTADALEIMLNRWVCLHGDERGAKQSIEDFGYGSGYAKVCEQWVRILNALDACVARGKNIIIIAHEQIKAFNNPMTDTYDKYQIKLNKNAQSLIVGRMDAVLFATYQTIIQKDKGDQNNLRASTNRKKVIYTVETPVYVAKNRYDLPEVMAMDETIFEMMSK